MAVDKLVDSSKLDAALNYEASRIIAKGGGTAPLAFDLENEKGFGDYVDAIPSGGGGIQKATGSFTIASSSSANTPTITHNLGTKKIAAIIYPVSVTPTNGYHLFYCSYVNVPELVDSGKWSLDFRTYNSTKFPNIVEIDPKNATDAQNIRDFGRQSSPWTTQGNWYDANNEWSFDKAVELTDNTFTPKCNNARWSVGSYKWVVFKLE